MDHASKDSILDRPLIHFGREICGDLDAALRREWLVTNGLGGYASAALPGTLTRSYHGLLVAALAPPVERTVLVAGLDEWATYSGDRYPLSTHEFNGGSVAPEGYRFLESFHLEGSLPVWTFAMADALLEKRIWMGHRRNTTYVRYQLLRSSAALDLELTPLLSDRSFHALQSGQGQEVEVLAGDQGAAIRFGDAGHPFWLSMNQACFEPDASWWWNFHFREESARGLEDTGDLFAPGTFRARLNAGEFVQFVATSEPDHEKARQFGPESARSRQLELLRCANAESSSPLTQQLVFAADQFIVTRPLPENPDGESIIAGYHWFNDWGRDTMISLPGLCLETGRTRAAEAILRTFANYIDQGLLPNNFPDQAGIVPGYNTADATLWYVIALYRYWQATGDDGLARDLLPVLEDIVRHHREGTHFHIAVDRHDGLLAAGESGAQLTWMDARVGDWVVTSRMGKPVEINALWYNALKIAAVLETRLGTPASGADFEALSEQVKSSFLRRFQCAELDHLADVIDGPDGDDWSMRPNQIFALSLPFALIDGVDACHILDTVGRKLLTSWGLRSLSPDDPAYIETYGGDQLRRDGAYHEGTVWSWLLGPFVDAHYRLHGDADAALLILAPMGDHLRDAGLGSISEIFEARAPFLPRGCIAQAWGVAETLRVLRMLSN
jgi:predicted glycogen debranching enzyme